MAGADDLDGRSWVGHDSVDPRSIHTAGDLSSALNFLRRSGGMTVRKLAASLGIPASTLGGYLSGGHLPRVQDKKLIIEIIRACGVHDSVDLAGWATAVDRVYGLRKPVLATGHVQQASEPGGRATDGTLTTSLQPPVERLRREPHMRGRTLLFRTLARAIVEQRDPRVHVLHGTGGAGKSFLSLTLARWAMNRGIRTWWISADEPVSVSLGMRALAVELGAPPHQFDLGSPTDVSWRLLNSHPRPWLLIVDNADDPNSAFASPNAPISDAIGWLRPLLGRYGTVIITTRDGSPGTWGAAPSWIRLHRVRALGATDAAHVLREVAGAAAGSLEEAAEVGARLGGLPLALRLAGMHMRDARGVPADLAWPGLVSTFSEYTRALDLGRHKEVLDTAWPERGRRVSVDQTWEISLDVLDSRGYSDARVLLRVLSCFSNAPIPYGLLLDPLILETSPLLAAGSRREGPAGRWLWRLLQAMAGLGLIDIVHDQAKGDRSAVAVTLHPVLRAVYRRSQEIRNEPGDYLALLVALLGGAARDLYPSDPVAWSQWHAFAAHCHSPLVLLNELGRPKDGPEPETVMAPAMLAAQYLRASGQLVEAESAYSMLLELGEKILGSADRSVLATRQGLCRVWYVMGRWERAEAGLRALLTDRCDLLGPEHPDTLVTQHYLARVRLDQGDVAEAENLFRATLDVRRRVLGPTDPATLSSMSNLANAWRLAGRLAEAEPILHHVLGQRRETLGEAYPSTLITREHLAELCLDRGVTPDDELEFRALAADTKRALGADHPRALAAGRLLSEALARLGKNAEALAVAEGILKRQRDTLGSEHPASRDTEALLSRHSPINHAG